MKQVLIKNGEAVVEEVPSPQVGDANLLVRVTHSCISVGTEMAGVKISGLPLYQRALKQPENVKKVLDMMRDQGIKRTLDRVRGKLSAGYATGYSAAGVVMEAGNEVVGFSAGDRVACAGAGIANHAEIIDVPVNLSVKISSGIDDIVASTVTLGAIALQGVRRANPTIGETFLVVGLGILGQITAQILLANGCRVIGVDLDSQRVQEALENGMDVGIDPVKEDYIDRVFKHTDGIGADAVIVTAASQSNQIISNALKSCRKKGRLILVGDVGLDLKRSDFYKNEVDFLISTSYGPGRYDPFYEEGGQDYPISYVRWTENRNMKAYLDLLSKGRIRLNNLNHRSYPIDEADKAYAALQVKENKPLFVVLGYPERKKQRIGRVDLKLLHPLPGKIQIALVGASSFAQGMHLPNLVKLRDQFRLRAVMSRTGANSLAVAKQYEADYCATDYDEILRDDAVDLVMITTRHDLHGSMVKRALHAGKHVFVEKPLSLVEEDLKALERFYSENENGPMLMVGFNRRFSPAMKAISRILKDRSTPIMANYRMNAGYIPPDHWVHGSEGGGRNIGEACHIYDLFTYLTSSSKIRSVNACTITPASKQWRQNDNFISTLKFSDGSVCSLTYTALGDKTYPKEKLEVFSDGKVIVMEDYKSVEVHGSNHKGWSSKVIQKGQKEELEALAMALSSGGKWPISLEDQLQATQISFEVENQIS